MDRIQDENAWRTLYERVTEEPLAEQQHNHKLGHERGDQA